MPTYQAMLSTAHELPEGSLVFLTNRQELYVRLRGGFRRVLVSGGAEGRPAVAALPGLRGARTAPSWGLGGDSVVTLGVPPPTREEGGGAAGI